MKVNCLEFVKARGYSLRGYSPDTIVNLHDTEATEDECMALFMWLEDIYG